MRRFVKVKIDRPIQFFVSFTSAFTCLGLACLDAAPLNGARLTYVSANVRMHATQNAPSPLSTGDILSAGLTIDNGAKARSELTFGNRSVVRLGANTILSLKDQLGAMELREGAILFQIPKGSSAEITTASITVASKDATGLLERNRDLYIKLLLLQGEARVFLADRVGESIVLEPGQILITKPKATALPEAAYFDIARAVRTCQLISEFPPLRGQESIANEARKQVRLTSNGNYIPSNLVIFGRGTLVNLLPAEALEKDAPKPTPKPQTTH
jgi:hypothetical protein